MYRCRKCGGKIVRDIITSKTYEILKNGKTGKLLKKETKHNILEKQDMCLSCEENTDSVSLDQIDRKSVV